QLHDQLPNRRHVRNAGAAEAQRRRDREGPRSRRQWDIRMGPRSRRKQSGTVGAVAAGRTRQDEVTVGRAGEIRRTRARRTVVRAAVRPVVIGLIVLWAWLVMNTLSAAPPEFRVSLSVSPFTETILKTGTRFNDATRSAETLEELQRLFVTHGANEVYARISTRKSVIYGPGNHSMNGALDRARIATALGLPLNPELGLFASYGDIR